MEWCPYTLRSRGSLNAVSRRREFHGALIRVSRGVGCLHPWPEFGDAEIEEQLETLRQGGTSKVIERALHMVEMDGEARRRGVSLFAGLEIPPCHYSWDQNQSAEPQMQRVVKEGWRAIKTKGTADVESMLRSFESPNALAGDAPVQVRVDFNSCLSEEQFVTFMGEMSSQAKKRLDFIEDPFPYDPLRWEEMRKRFGVRLALDKQLRGAKEGFDVAVLKPGRREWREMVKELPPQVRVVMTSAMDHAVGQSFAAYEAALAWKELGSRMDLCGLCTEHLFEEDAFFALLSSRGGRLKVDRNGTGLGFDDVLEKLPWRGL
jgi:o-succinylbenzoate synthase